MSHADEYVIWSYEHQAWWAPDRRGYTRDLLAAGRYTHTQATAIVAEANIVAIEETMLSFAAACHRPMPSVRERVLLNTYAALTDPQREAVDALMRQYLEDDGLEDAPWH